MRNIRPFSLVHTKCVEINAVSYNNDLLFYDSVSSTKKQLFLVLGCNFIDFILKLNTNL